jgi:hypothetical protein
VLRARRRWIYRNAWTISRNEAFHKRYFALGVSQVSGERARELLAVPDRSTLMGKRDYVIKSMTGHFVVIP